jgi:hypothetical protein
MDVGCERKSRQKELESQPCLMFLNNLIDLVTMPVARKTMHRLQIDLTEVEFARLELLVESTEAASFSEVVREALKQREALIKLAHPPPVGEGMILYAEHPKSKKRVRFLRI